MTQSHWFSKEVFSCDTVAYGVSGFVDWHQLDVVVLVELCESQKEQNVTKKAAVSLNPLPLRKQQISLDLHVDPL